MGNDNERLDSIDAYITTFAEDVQFKLEKLRAVIQAAAPEAEEKSSIKCLLSI